MTTDTTTGKVCRYCMFGIFAGIVTLAMVSAATLAYAIAIGVPVIPA